MDANDTHEWFAEYARVFEACGRGATEDIGRLMSYYGVPLLLATEATAVALMTEQDVLAAVHDPISGMRAAGYDRSETLDSETTSVNATTAFHTAEFARRRADASEIGRLRATYLIIDSESDASLPWPYTQPDHPAWGAHASAGAALRCCLRYSARPGARLLVLVSEGGQVVNGFGAIAAVNDGMCDPRRED